MLLMLSVISVEVEIYVTIMGHMIKRQHKIE